MLPPLPLVITVSCGVDGGGKSLHMEYCSYIHDLSWTLDVAVSFRGSCLEVHLCVSPCLNVCMLAHVCSNSHIVRACILVCVLGMPVHTGAISVCIGLCLDPSSLLPPKASSALCSLTSFFLLFRCFWPPLQMLQLSKCSN